MEKFEQSPIKPQEKEKSPEELSFEYARGVYASTAGAYTEYRKAFGGMKEKDLAGFEKTIEPAREWIKAGDSQKIKSEKEEEFLYAQERKENFIKELNFRGIKKERAEAIYEAELKKAEYEAAKVEVGKKMAESGVSQAEIFKKLVLDERELLNQQKVESWPPKEKGILRKGMEWYMRRGTATRLLISTGLITGVVAGAGGFGASAAAMFAGYRFVRGAGSVIMGKLAGKGVDWAMSRGIQAQKEASLEKLKSSFDLNNLKETEKELEKIFEETAKKERRKLLIKAAASVMAGAGTAIGMGMLEQAWAGGVKVAPEMIKPQASIEEIPLKPAPVPEILPISERGPEGSIIDYFKGNPETAKNFGWNGQTDLDKWAGIKAHQLWLEDAQEALAKPETLERLKELGYSTDAEGYSQMMQSIGKGAVEIDPQTGEINLVETEYLKAPVEPIEELKAAKITAPEIPSAKTTEEIFASTSPEITRGIITDELHDSFGMWSGTYDKFSDVNLKEFLKLDSAAGYRVTGAPWEDYDYNKFSGLQNKMEKVYNALGATGKGEAAGKSVETFIKRYFTKIFEGK